MKTTRFANSTALTLCLALMTTGATLAQSENATCPDGTDPPCKAGKGQEERGQTGEDARDDAQASQNGAAREAVPDSDSGNAEAASEQAADQPADDAEEPASAKERSLELSAEDIDVMGRSELVDLVEETGLPIEGGEHMEIEALRRAVKSGLGLPVDMRSAEGGNEDAEGEAAEPMAGTEETEAELDEAQDKPAESAAKAEADQSQTHQRATQETDKAKPEPAPVEEAAPVEEDASPEEETAAAREELAEPAVDDVSQEENARAEETRDTRPQAAKEDVEAADISSETVTEDTARSSDEEFNTDVIVEQDGGNAAQVTSQATAVDDRDGLGELGTAAAIGLGALALSQILDNDDEVISNSGDRVVVRRDGNLEVFKNDDVHLRQPGSKVETQHYSDGSTRTVLTRPNGARVITIRAADGRVLRRERIRPNGKRIVLFDDTVQAEDPVNLGNLPLRDRDRVTYSDGDRRALERALHAELADDIDRRFSLRQVRDIPQVRHLMPEVTLDAVNFQTGSSVIQPREVEDLADLGRAMADFIDGNPDEIFLVEGHTDTVGDPAYNLALSDRRAESVALALVEYFDVPPENLVIQGYGESDLLVPRAGPERANRRATVRRITPLLRTADRR